MLPKIASKLPFEALHNSSRRPYTRRASRMALYSLDPEVIGTRDGTCPIAQSDAGVLDSAGLEVRCGRVFL